MAGGNPFKPLPQNAALSCCLVHLGRVCLMNDTVPAHTHKHKHTQTQAHGLLKSHTFSHSLKPPMRQEDSWSALKEGIRGLQTGHSSEGLGLFTYLRE